MKIKVISRQRRIKYSDSDVDFLLMRDGWNDYNYFTSYSLFLTPKHSKDGSLSLIGGLKILKKGQEKSEWDLINLGIIDSLSKEFCSLGQSLDYYQRIATLDYELKNQILKSLNDVIYIPSIKKDFENENGFKDSLMRFVDSDSDVFSLAPIILSGDFENVPDDDTLKFNFKTSEMSDFINFDFSSNGYKDEWGRHNELPNRIITIIGKNGSGKTTFLSKLSRLVFSSTEDREKRLKSIAEISPKGLGFPRIISVSYSAFDTFKVPGVKIVDVEQISKEIQTGIGRYSYCGMRSIVKELDFFIEENKSNMQEYLSDEYILNIKNDLNILKTFEELNDEYKQSLEMINSNEVKLQLLNNVIRILSQESSFSEIFLNSSGTTIEILSEIFNELSTGHKFILHTLISIIKSIEKNSLVLFDEPEIHLHPPLLSVLMKSLRFILYHRSSYMIVATHSPVILQETLSRHVFIMKRIGNQINFFQPEIQTFGENIGVITSHVFGLNSDVTSYHNDLNYIVDVFKKYDNNLSQTIDEISKLFDDNISTQARAYLMTKLMEKR